MALELAQATTAIILAGGRGTRIADLTPNIPKPMVPVAGEPFLEWIIRRLPRENFTDILLSIGHMADVVIKWTAARVPGARHEVIRCHAEQSPMGTGGAIADILPLVQSEYVLILNGDTLLLCDFLPALQRMVAENLRGIIMARFLEDTGRYGRLGVQDGLLTEFQEKMPGQRLNSQGLINGGVYLFHTDWLRRHIGAGPSSIELDVFPRLLREGAKIGVESTTAPFIDIGTPETLAEADRFVCTHAASFI